MQTTLAWAPSSDEDVVGYQIRYGTASRRYDKSVDVGDATTAVVSNLTTGSTYYFVVTAYNSARLESGPSNEIAVRMQSQAPSVSLTAPDDGAFVQAGARINLSAVASDQDGSILKVEFYRGNKKIGEDASAPYTIEWVVPKSGRVQLSARAVDNDGVRTASAPVFVTVRSAGAPFVKGAYAGMVTMSEGDARYGGAFTLSPSATGVFTGNLKWNGASYRLKGRFDATGAALITIPRKNATPLVVNLRLSDTSNVNGGIEGTVSDGTAMGAVAGERSGGIKKSSHAGKWTVLFRSPAGSASGEAEQKGSGYGTVVVSSAGVARIKGALADGTAFSYGASLLKDSEWPVYVPLYKNKGTLAGLVQFGAGETGGETLEGTTEWFKPSGLSGNKLYPDGLRVELEVVGAKYRVPKKGLPPLDLNVGPDMGMITWSDGNLAAPFSKTLSVSKAGKISVSNAGAERVKLQINTGVGTFSGSFFDLSVRKTRRFSGAILQEQGVAEGFFVGDTAAGTVKLFPNN